MPRNPKIPNHINSDAPAYVSWAGSSESYATASKEFTKALDSIQPINRTSSSLEVRQGMDREDYEFWRPGEALPRKQEEILAACMSSYDRVGIINNVMNLMSDFTSQGIKIVHPNSQVEKFHQTWWQKVDGAAVAEQFCSLLYMAGRVPIDRTWGKLSQRVQDEMKRGLAAIGDDQEVYKVPSKQIPPKNTIPWGYTFRDPRLIRLIGGDLALFSGKPVYGLEIPAKLATLIRNPKTADERDMVASLPSEVVEAAKTGRRIVKLNSDNFSVFHYKKKDWQSWALPMIYSVMDDILLLQKMKLCDLAALDGAISHIRIWKLGSLTEKIWPTQAAIEKLNEALIYAGNGQSFDIIWGPDLTVEETKTDVYQFLGKAKYEPVLSSIYAGLGIPSTLTGSGGEKGGFTNNFLSLKTLVERLNYGRDMLVRFWTNELKMIQQAMNFRFPAQIEFKHMILTDEAAQHQLLINLLDRDVIGLDTVREQFGFIPEVEAAAIQRDYKLRDSGRIPPKAGIFHEAQPDLALQKIALQNDLVTPGQIGMELEPRKPGEKLMIERQPKKPLPTDGPKGQPGQGRPPGKKDSAPRKQKRVLPRSAADQFSSISTWARGAQEAIGAALHPKYLELCKKSNMRKLTVAQTEDLERLKFSILCNLEPFAVISEERVGQMLQSPLPIPEGFEVAWKSMVGAYCGIKKSQPTIDEIHHIQSEVYSMNHLNNLFEDQNS